LRAEAGPAEAIGNPTLESGERLVGHERHPGTAKRYVWLVVAVTGCVSVKPTFGVIVDGHGRGETAAAEAVFGTRIGTLVMPVFGHATDVLDRLTVSVTDPTMFIFPRLMRLTTFATCLSSAPVAGRPGKPVSTLT
jgi:hypothetical protein